jgi:hypothetical protein
MRCVLDSRDDREAHLEHAPDLERLQRQVQVPDFERQQGHWVDHDCPLLVVVADPVLVAAVAVEDDGVEVVADVVEAVAAAALVGEGYEVEGSDEEVAVAVDAPNAVLAVVDLEQMPLVLLPAEGDVVAEKVAARSDLDDQDQRAVLEQEHQVDGQSLLQLPVRSEL